MGIVECEGGVTLGYGPSGFSDVSPRWYYSKEVRSGSHTDIDNLEASDKGLFHPQAIRGCLSKSAVYLLFSITRRGRDD